MRSRAQVNILEAKNQLSRLVKEARAGREIVIASNGKPMAKLVPLRAPGGLRRWGVLKVPQSRVDSAFTPGVDRQIARLFRVRGT